MEDVVLAAKVWEVDDENLHPERFQRGAELKARSEARTTARRRRLTWSMPSAFVR